jgi:alpha-D-ribose 1-methylphosphonate 5-triphosphate synthase subunit PhnH
VSGPVPGGGFASQAQEAARVFRAALDAMARPGRIHRVGGGTPPAPLPVAAGALALTLCDPETPLWLGASLATPAVEAWLGFHTGAPRAAARAEAAFAIGRWEELAPLESWPAGTPEYPDRSATLIVCLDRLEPGGTRLTGPGIRGGSALPLPDPAAVAANRARFPLGLDLFLVAGDRLAAVPRSARPEPA